MRSVVLSGFMATGKSTLGPLLAGKLGIPFLDVDTEMERLAGRSIADLWRAEGEARFRSKEQEIVSKFLLDATPRVLAFGGGAVLNRTVRHLALERAVVITLQASPRVVLQRAAGGASRPLLDTPDPAARIAELLDQRAAAYAECHL